MDFYHWIFSIIFHILNSVKCCYRVNTTHLFIWFYFLHHCNATIISIISDNTSDHIFYTCIQCQCVYSCLPYFLHLWIHVYKYLNNCQICFLYWLTMFPFSLSSHVSFSFIIFKSTSVSGNDPTVILLTWVGVLKQILSDLYSSDLVFVTHPKPWP